MIKQIMFPYNKVKAGSRVVLYGAGNIGRGIYNENLRSCYCNIVAIADKMCGKVIDNITVIEPREIESVEFDYIIICTIDGYQEEMCQQLFDIKIPQEKIVCVDSFIEPTAEVKDYSVMIDAFHYLMINERYRDISLETNPEVFQWYRNHNNWLIDTNNIIELLLKGYNALEPVFQIIDDDNRYIGTIDRKVIQILLELQETNIGECTIRDICEKCVLNHIAINQASDISLSVCGMYKRFREEPELTEIPLTKEGILEDVIRRTDFNAFFAKDNVTETKVYLSGRFRDFNKYGGGVKKYAYNVNSQNGEDGIIEYIFSKIGFYSCFAVEFGGWDGIYLSNIRNLILNNDMYALFIEGDSEKALEGQKNYNGNSKVKFINEWVHFKNDRKLDDILEENDAPKEIDLLSIDIDGYDYWVWDSLKKYRPRVVIIEFNPTVSNSVVMISPVNEEPLYGSSALAMVELGKRKGYELVAVTDCNCIFVVNEEFEKIDITDNSLEYLRRESLRDFALPMMTFRGDVLNGIFGK